MAADARLVRTAARPVLRFYRWARPTLSLGRRQVHDPPDVLERLPDKLPVVVRPTGGGYLLHADEITYSLTIPRDHPLGELSVHAFYGRVRDAFQEAVRAAGLVKGNRRGDEGGDEASCLAAPAAHEPVEQGAKWMAAAQVRRREGLLQHGSLFWSAAGWPEDLEHRPYFLRDAAGETTKKKLRARLIRSLSRRLPGGRFTPRVRDRGEAVRIERMSRRFTYREKPSSTG